MSNVLRELLNSGAVTLYADYRNLSCRDLGPLQRHGTIAGTDVRFSPLGAHFTGTGRIQHPDHVAGRNMQGSIIVLADFTAVAGAGVEWILFHARYAGGVTGRVCVELYATNVYVETAAGSSTTPSTPVTGKKCLAVDYATGNKPLLYLNGVYTALFGSAITVTAIDSRTSVGGLYGGGLTCPFPIACVFETNVQLTADQHSKLYSELAQIQYPQRPYEVILPNSLTTSNRRGLVGRWDPGSTSAGVCSDTSDTGAHGTVTGTGNLWVEDSPLGKVARIDGNRYLDCGAFAAAKGVSACTISAWLKRTAATTGGYSVGFYNTHAQRIHLAASGTSWYWCVSNGTNSAGSYVQNDTLWHHFVLRFDGTQVDNATRLRGWVDGQEVALAYVFTVPATTSVAANNWKLGSTDGGGNSLGSCGPVAVWSRALDPAEIVQEYRRARPAGFKSDWGVPVSSAQRGGVAGAELETTGWRHGDTTGRYWVDTSTINGTVVKTIRCSTGGMVYLPTATLGQSASDAAFGEWTIPFSKGAGAVASWLMPISNQTTLYNVVGCNGYILYSAAPPNLDLRLLRITNGVIAATLITSSVFVVAGSFYLLKLTRNTLGVFNLWAKGGAITSWQLLGTSAPDLTHAVSNNMTLDLDPGDVVALGGTAGEFAISKTLTV